MFWCVLLTVAVSLQTAAPQAMEDTDMRQLGLLLDLPVDLEEVPLERNEPPQFLNDIYNCWSSNNSSTCLPGYHGDDVNMLRAFLGVEIEVPSKAVHSYNDARELKNSMAISFQISFTYSQTDLARYSMLRVYRNPLSADQILSLQQKCNNFSNVNLQLYTQTSVKNGIPVFSLRAVQSLSESDFTRGEWIEFFNLTKMYKSTIQSIQRELNEAHLTELLQMRLTLSGPCPDLSPSELGFTSTSEHRAQLLGMVENSMQKELIFSRVVRAIVEERARRDTIDSGSGSESSQESADITTSSTQSSINNYLHTKCRLRKLYISFEDLELVDDIVHPSGFEANFCAGHCMWPLDRNSTMNMRTYIQSLANFKNEDLIPPPCCVPNPDKLENLTTSINISKNEFVVHIYPNMIAKECLCM